MRVCLVLLAIALLGPVATRACSIPVFRYALDRWPADAYALEISPTDARRESVAHFLRNFTDSTPLNLTPLRANGEGASRLVFPHPAPGEAPAWAGTLDDAALASLTDSPARTELVRRILEGQSGVWVLVESGEREADERAAGALERRLRYLEQVAQIPEIDPNDPTSRVGPGPALRVEFSVLRIGRDAAGEQAFLKMLAGSKRSLATSTEPWVALVFGRGRVLGAWPVEGFGDEQIDEACLFLLGACSCQVKRMNPGWDLLLHADWDAALHAVVPASAPVARLESIKPAPLPVETITFTAVSAEPVAAPRREIHLVGAGALVLLVLGSAFALVKMRKL